VNTVTLDVLENTGQKTN